MCHDLSYQWKSWSKLLTEGVYTVSNKYSETQNYLKFWLEFEKMFIFVAILQSEGG